MIEHDKEILDLRALDKNVQEQKTASAPERITWETEEFPYYEKDFKWFLLAGIIVTGVLISLLILKNVFGAATLLLFAIIGYVYALKKPDMLSITIDAQGVAVNGKTIGYSQITSFWVLYEPPVKDLIIIRKEHFMPKTIIPLGDANPVEVRSLLLANAITEKEEEESIADILSRRFGF